MVEIAEVGKYLALNEGDRLAGDVYPRLYCDADIRLSPTSITALVEALTSDEVTVAAPEVRSAVEESTWTVKVFFRAVENPLIAQWNYGLLAGRGLYGPSRAARRRFDVFPDLYADDLFFDSQSGPTEKIALSDATAVLRVPVNLRHLMKGEIRVADGNRQYRAAEHVEGGTTEDTAVHRDRFERSMRVRISALWRRRAIPLLLWYSHGDEHDLDCQEVARTQNLLALSEETAPASGRRHEESGVANHFEQPVPSRHDRQLGS